VNYIRTKRFCSTLERKVLKSKAIIEPFSTKKTIADNSNKEESGSQQTRQWTRNEGSNQII
jgi:hypothetical protein